MELTKKDKTIKYIVYVIILCLCALLQNVAGLMFEIGGARCFILVPVCVILGMNEDEKIAGFLGLLGGILLDMVSTQQMGFSAVVLMVMCFLSASMVTYYFRNTFVVSIVCSIATIIIYCFLYWLLFIVVRGVEGGGNTLWYFYIPCMIYTGILTPLFWLILRPIKRN